MPLGFLAGKEIALDMAINQLASELLGHAADLEETAERAKRDPKKYDQTPETMEARAADLRRYGWAAWVVWLQLAERDPEELKALTDVADRYKLKLPQGLL